MRPKSTNRFLFASALVLPAVLCLSGQYSQAADRWWDGGATNIATNGNGLSGGAAGTWDTTLSNWDQGDAQPHVAWNNTNIDTAILGTVGVTGGNIAINTNVTVNQMKFLGRGFNVGQSGTGVITFGGTYSDAFPTIDASSVTSSTAGNGSVTISRTISGTLSGGMVVSHGDSITTPGSSSRIYFTAAANNTFIGDVTVLAGNLHVLSSLGDASNKIILKGGALFGSSGSAITYNVSRQIEVAANSAIGLNGAVAGVHMELASGKAITGAGNLTRYNSNNATSEVRLLGDMSGYTGTFDNTGGVLVAQASATSGGVWKLTGGTLKLNTTDDTHIANGAGKSDLLMNGGTLDMNGKSETINGISGPSGFVQNALASTVSTLTLGDGDTTATYGGSLRNNAGTGGTLALTKTGSGTQTLTGTLTHTGATQVNSGALHLSTATGTLPTEAVPSPANSAFTVANSATLGIRFSGTGPSSAALASLTTGASGAGSTLVLDSMGFGLVPASPLVTCVGSFAPGADATTKIKIKGYDFTKGQVSLIGYATLDGAGFAGLAVIVPYRMAATLVDNAIDKMIDLDITSAETAVWKGEVGGSANGDWDISPDGAPSAGTENWKTSVAGTTTRYAQGPNNTDQVTFNDDLSPTGTSTVNLTTTLTPLHVRVRNTATAYTFTGTGKLSGETALEKDGMGKLIIANTGLNDHTGGTQILAGTLQLGDGITMGAGRLGGSITNSATLAFFHPEPVTFTNPITGSNGALLKLGSNTLTLNAANTYGGGTTISTGTIAAATATALGSDTVTLGDAATGGDAVELMLDNRADIANPVTVSADGSGTATLSASNTGTGTTNPASFTGIITLDRATTFRNDIAGDALVFSGAITSTPPEPPATALTPVSLTLAGGQTISLESTANDFTGEILVTGAGTTLQAKRTTGSEVIPDAVRVDLAAGTFFKLAVAGSPVETIARLTGTGKVERSITGTQTLAVGFGGASSTFDGEIRNGTGLVALRKIDGGTFTLSNTNTYTGTTFVLAGTLLVNGSITSATTVTDDADPLVPSGTLGGTGTVAAVTVTNTGKLSPATDTTLGTLTATGHVIFSSATEEFIAQINSNGTPSCDRLAVTGNLTLNDAKLTLTDLGSTTLSATTRLILATYSGTLTGTFKDGSGTTIADGADVIIGSNTYKINYADPEGTGKAITLTKGTAGGYNSWATANGVGAADTDFDNDGVKNGLEYVLGTDPKSATTTGIVSMTTATEFKFEFTRSDASETTDTAVFVEVSNDLANWTASGSPYAVGATSSGSVTVVENPADPAADPGTDKITLTVPRDASAKFARLKVVVTP